MVLTMVEEEITHGEAVQAEASKIVRKKTTKVGTTVEIEAL